MAQIALEVKWNSYCNAGAFLFFLHWDGWCQFWSRSGDAGELVVSFIHAYSFGDMLNLSFTVACIDVPVPVWLSKFALPI